MLALCFSSFGLFSAALIFRSFFFGRFLIVYFFLSGGSGSVCGGF